MARGSAGLSHAEPARAGGFRLVPAAGDIRVCFLIGKYPPRFGGHGIQIRRSLPYLERHGIRPTVLTDRIPGPARIHRDEDRERVCRLFAPGSDPLSRALRILQMRRHFGKNRHSYDLVHSALLRWEFLANIPYLKSLGLPLIVEMVLLGGDDPLTISQERLGGFKIGLLRRIDAWIGIAGAFLPRVIAARIPPDRFRLIYCGVDVHRYRPRSDDERRALRSTLGLPPDGRMAVSVGSIIRRKGVDRVLRAWAEIRPMAGRDVLVVVGPQSLSEGLAAVDLGYAEAVRALGRSPKLAGTVRFVGKTDRVEDYMAAADLFLFLSRREGLGYVILEAMSCGLPCVVSPLDGIASELVAEGRTGFIVADPDDAEAAAAPVVRLLTSPELRRSFGAAARRAAVERFSFEARAAALAQLYRQVLAYRNGRG